MLYYNIFVLEVPPIQNMTDVMWLKRQFNKFICRPDLWIELQTTHLHLLRSQISIFNHIS